ncbi:MAG: CHAT domain-containing protein [Bacteroidota bacterium]
MMRPYLLLLGFLLCFSPYSGNAQSGIQTTAVKSNCASSQLEEWISQGREFRKAGDYEAAIQSFKQVLACDLEASVAYTANRYLGNAYYLKGDYKLAMLTYDRADAIYPSLAPKNQKFRGNIFRDKGQIFLRWGDYQQAANSFSVALAHAKSPQTKVAALTNLGLAHRYLLDYPQAQKYYQQALDSVSDQSHLEAFIWSGFAELALDQEDYPGAIKHYTKAKKLFVASPYYQFFVPEIEGNLASVYTLSGQQQSAKKSFAHAIAQGHQLIDSTRELGKIYLAQAQYFEQQNQPESALKSYQAALAQVLDDIDQIDLLSFTMPAQFPPENVIMDALAGKACVFRTLAETSTDASKYRQLALQHWQWALQSQASLRANYQEHTSKYQLVNETRALAEPAIEEAWQLWQKTQDPKYLHIGFELSERTKASMMLELMRELDLRDFQAIPSGERSAWDSLQTQLASIERELIVPQADKNSKELENQRFALKQAIIRLENDWEQNYPDYQAAKNDLRTRSLPEIQSQLSPKKAMLSYSIGETQSSVFLIRADRLIWQKLEIDASLNQQILKFREALELGALDLDQQSWALYQKLLAPIEDHWAGIEHLMIVPDQAMALLPFEALLMQQAGPKQKSYEKAYLLRKFPLSYAFSATLWSEMKGSQSTALNPNILAVAPDFPYSAELLAMAQAPDYNPTRACLDPIQNLAEIDSLAELSDIITLIGKQATREQLLAQLEQYAFVHIATHAMADDQDPNKTFLVLREEGSVIEICEESYQDLTALYMNELLHHRIGAEMVVLAACQTGIGKYHHGEGLASLARSFALAGANSVVASLWSVDDRSTRKMMPRFYQYLKDGDSKDLALQKAKIDILEGGLGDPVYWASFIVMGDPAPVEIPDKKHKAWWALLLLLPLLMIIVRRSRKKPSKSQL